MSDDIPHDNASDECPYPSVCAYHQMMRTKVRAIHLDGEVYVSATDTAEWIKNVAILDVSYMESEAQKVATSPEALQSIELAARNYTEGAKRAYELLMAMPEQQIKPIGDNQGLLVDPHELDDQIPDSVPTAWTTEPKEQS